MAQQKSQEVKLPTKANSSLRSKTIGRLSIFGGKQAPESPKSQTWHKNSPGIPESSTRTVPRPDITWEPGMFTVDYILRNLPLPRVIQCDHSLCDLGKGSMGFDCRQLFLLKSKNEALKIRAGSLAVSSKDGKSLVETDDRLLVPEDYKGWFAVLGKEMLLKAVPHYRHTAQLAQSDCHTFLIGGTENIRSVQKVGVSVSDSRHLCPGDILKMGTLDETQKYLHCTDENDRDVLIPVEAVGMFYVMKNKTHPSKVPILQIKEILRSQKFPCIVKLIYGREPVGEGVFTKILSLEGVQQEKSVLASTLLKAKNTLHELTVETPNKFRVAVQSKELVHNAGYISALNLCQDKGDLFMRSIKIFRPIKGSIEPRVTAMGITFPSPVGQKASPQAHKEATRSVSESSKVVSEPVKATVVPSPRVSARNTSAEASSSPIITSVVVKPTDVNEGKVDTPHSKRNGDVKPQLQDQIPKQPDRVTTVNVPPVVISKPLANTTSVNISNSDKKPKPTVIKVQPQVQQTASISTDFSSPHHRRQRDPDQDSTPPPPPLTPPTAMRFESEHLPPPSSVQNGDVNVMLLGSSLKSNAARTNAYEEVWTATTGKDDSASDDLSSTTSSMSDTYIQSGMGGQIITGGITPAPTPAPAPPSTPASGPSQGSATLDPKKREQNIQKINVVASNAKKQQAQRLLEHYSSIDIVDGKPGLKGKESKAHSYSTIDIIDEEDNSTDSEGFRDRTQRKKKVSFSDILDVQTIPQQHVTTINVDEKTKREQARKAEERLEIPLGTKFYESGLDFKPDLSGLPADLATRPSAEDSSEYSSIDDLGYLIPVLDRKGRVKLEDAQKVHSEHEKPHGDITRRISLPNMRVTDPGEASAKKEKRRDSEADILW